MRLLDAVHCLLRFERLLIVMFASPLPSILGWSEVHRRWLRCSLQIPSDYMRYRIADELLRGAIASRAHIRVIAFCLVGATHHVLTHTGSQHLMDVA